MAVCAWEGKRIHVATWPPADLLTDTELAVYSFHSPKNTMWGKSLTAIKRHVLRLNDEIITEFEEAYSFATTVSFVGLS